VTKQLIVAGLSLEKILKEFGVNLSRKVAERAVMRAAWMAIEVIPGYIINSVGVRAGYLLVIRYGTSKGAALLYKSLPIVSGVVGGALDSGLPRVSPRLPVWPSCNARPLSLPSEAVLAAPFKSAEPAAWLIRSTSNSPGEPGPLNPVQAGAEPDEQRRADIGANHGQRPV
jgi:hypothetical protein